MNSIQTVLPIPPHYQQWGLQVNQLLQNSSMPQRLVLQMCQHRHLGFVGGIAFDSTEPAYMQHITHRLMQLYCINNHSYINLFKKLFNFKYQRRKLKEEISMGFNMNYYNRKAEDKVRQKTQSLIILIYLGTVVLLLAYVMVSQIFAHEEYYNHMHEPFIWDANEICFNQTPIYQLINNKQQGLCKPLQCIILHFPFGFSIESGQILWWVIGCFAINPVLWVIFIIMAWKSERYRKLIIGVHPLQRSISQRGGPLKLVQPSYHISKSQANERTYKNYHHVHYDSWYLRMIDWEIKDLQRKTQRY